MCGQHNVMAISGDNIRQNTNKGHTSSLRIEMKISDPPRLKPGLSDWKEVNIPTMPWRLIVYLMLHNNDSFQFQFFYLKIYS